MPWPRTLLACVLLLPLAASCNTTKTTPAPTPTPTTVKQVRVTSLDEMTFQYRTANNVPDDQGIVRVRVGAPVICFNRSNAMRIKFSWTGDLGSANIQLRGVTAPAATKLLGSFQYPAQFTADQAIEATMYPGVSPLSLRVSALVTENVTATAFKGEMFPLVEVLDTDGVIGGRITTTVPVAVVTCP